MNKIIWAGGPHGVGKTTSLNLVTIKNPSLNYLYLGRMFYETADKMGFRWINLADESKLLSVENRVAQELEEKINGSDLLIDCHFVIYFGDGIAYPGFHKENLKYLFSKSNHKTGVLYLMADPETILERRKSSDKKFKAYKTQEEVTTMKRELADSEKYWRYFIDALKPNITARKIDTSKISLEEVVNKIGEMYNAM